ncbi:MAG: hypothetical protein ACREPQ_09695 [Rhodanobacter sp.]
MRRVNWEILEAMGVAAGVMTPFVIGFANRIRAHSDRLVALEVRSEEMAHRLDRHETQVLEYLRRIEDAVNRKADKL